MPKTHMVSFDAVSRKTLKMHEPGHTNEIIFETKADISDQLEINKEIRKAQGKRFNRGDADTLFARIPPVVYWNLPAHIRNDEEAFLKWLQQDEQEPFRAHEGRL